MCPRVVAGRGARLAAKEYGYPYVQTPSRLVELEEMIA